MSELGRKRRREEDEGDIQKGEVGTPPKKQKKDVQYLKKITIFKPSDDGTGSIETVSQRKQVFPKRSYQEIRNDVFLNCTCQDALGLIVFLENNIIELEQINKELRKSQESLDIVIDQFGSLDITSHFEPSFRLRPNCESQKRITDFSDYKIVRGLSNGLIENIQNNTLSFEDITSLENDVKNISYKTQLVRFVLRNIQTYYRIDSGAIDLVQLPQIDSQLFIPTVNQKYQDWFFELYSPPLLQNNIVVDTTNLKLNDIYNNITLNPVRWLKENIIAICELSIYGIIIPIVMKIGYLNMDYVLYVDQLQKICQEIDTYQKDTGAIDIPIDKNALPIEFKNDIENAFIAYKTIPRLRRSQYNIQESFNELLEQTYKMSQEMRNGEFSDFVEALSGLLGSRLLEEHKSPFHIRVYTSFTVRDIADRKDGFVGIHPVKQNDIWTGIHKAVGIPSQIIYTEYIQVSFDSILDSQNNPLYLGSKEIRSLTMKDAIEVLYTRQSSFDDLLFKSHMTQVIFGLCIMQETYCWMHNDLHSENIMYESTDIESLQYSLRIMHSSERYVDVFFKVPTYGLLMKIIDFGFSSFKFTGDMKKTIESIFYNSITEAMNENPITDIYGWYIGMLDKLVFDATNPANDLRRLVGSLYTYTVQSDTVGSFFKSFIPWKEMFFGRFMSTLFAQKNPNTEDSIMLDDVFKTCISLTKPERQNIFQHRPISSEDTSDIRDDEKQQPRKVDTNTRTKCDLNTFQYFANSLPAESCPSCIPIEFIYQDLKAFLETPNDRVTKATSISDFIISERDLNSVEPIYSLGTLYLDEDDARLFNSIRQYMQLLARPPIQPRGVNLEDVIQEGGAAPMLDAEPILDVEPGGFGGGLGSDTDTE